MPPSDNPNVPEISITVKADILSKKTVTIRLQGQMLIALEKAAHDRREEIKDVIRDVLEQRMVKDGYLPSWWFERQGRYH